MLPTIAVLRRVSSNYSFPTSLFASTTALVVLLGLLVKRFAIVGAMAAVAMIAQPQELFGTPVCVLRQIVERRNEPSRPVQVTMPKDVQ
jgi:hypothetical protein